MQSHPPSCDEASPIHLSGKLGTASVLDQVYSVSGEHSLPSCNVASPAQPEIFQYLQLHILVPNINIYVSKLCNSKSEALYVVQNRYQSLTVQLHTSAYVSIRQHTSAEVLYLLCACVRRKIRARARHRIPIPPHFPRSGTCKIQLYVPEYLTEREELSLNTRCPNLEIGAWHKK